MTIPTRCETLVIGGGPAGSYAASVLAREGIDTVLLESEVFPRYHVGESMLPSLRHFLRFIDLDSIFNTYGFQIKKGATFKLNTQEQVDTHFVGAGGPEAYTWNIVRSEADDLLFKHAGKSGAQIFDGVKVDSLAFLQSEHGYIDHQVNRVQVPKAVSAEWLRKDGSSGRITFDHLIDASGRCGLVSCKYLKNRKYNQGLKHMANWAYWKDANVYGQGIQEEGYPYFEHLQDGTGWVWFIPLHNGTTSVGVVMKQDVAAERKKASTSSTTKNFYLQTINEQCPGIRDLLTHASLAEEKIHSAADWSYSASTYASANIRIAGDAGCFVDPFFSSGVHIALASGLSAAATIAAVKRGQCEEGMAGDWHTAKVQEIYTRFYLVVSSAITQIRQGDVNILSDIDEDGFNTAFAHFEPIIQGTVDVKPELTQEKLFKMLDFCGLAFERIEDGKREKVLNKLKLANKRSMKLVDNDSNSESLKEILDADEMQILRTIRGRELIRHESILDLGSISGVAINGLSVNLARGKLGLVPKTTDSMDEYRADGLGQILGEQPHHNL